MQTFQEEPTSMSHMHVEVMVCGVMGNECVNLVVEYE